MDKSSDPEASGPTEPVVAMDSLRIGAHVQKFQAPTTFPFQLLTMELQLLMLQHILVAPTPILNLLVPLRSQKFLVKGEEKGQTQINPRIIFTCKLYYKEGLHLLYSHNTFLYTECWTTFAYTLSSTQLKEHQEWLNDKSSPSPPSPIQQPASWLPSFQTHAANIHIRLPFTDDPDFIDHCQKLVETADRFPHLRTLQLDFLNVDTGYQDRWDESPDSLDGLRAAVGATATRLRDPTRSAGPLREILLSGLPRNDLSVYVVAQYARLLAASGRMGVGWGAKGRRYELLSAAGEGEAARRAQVEVLWMGGEEVGGWVGREWRSPGSRWLGAGR